MAAEIGSTLEVRSGWLYTAASWIVEAEETGARQPPRSLIQRIEDGSAPSEQECAELQARASELAPHGGPPEDSAAEDDGLSDADRELEQQQMVRNAANMDFDQLCHASSLPTLLKLLAIPQLRERAARTVCRIALRSEPPDLRTAAQKRLQRAALKTKTARGLGLWARPKTMSEILDEANWVVNEAGDARAARTTGLEKKMAELAGFGQIEGSGADGDGAAGSGVDPVSKEELTALLQKHVTWGFVGGSDRFRVRVRKVISRTEGPAGLQVLPAIDKRGPEHAIGEHHVSVAIWGKPGDVGEKPLKPSDEDSGGKNPKKQQAVEEKHGTMSRFNSGRELVGDVERLYKEMQARTHARLQACGMEAAADDSSDDQKGGNKNAKKKDLSEMRGKPITTVTRHEMSVAISRIAIALSVLQEEGRLGLVKLDISGCDLEDQPVATIGQILLSELGLWGGTDSASSGVATMAEALLRSQKDGKLGPIKMRLVQCTLDTRAQAAYDKLDKVPPPPLPDSAPGEDYETGGIPIMINEDWYRLGSYQARFAAAEMMAESLGAKAAGIDLGDDGTLTRSEKHMIFSRFYKKHCPGDKKKGGKVAVEALVKRHRGAKFIALCENMKRKYRESPLEMWEVLMGGAEDRKRDLDHELAVVKAEEAHQTYLKETGEEHETLLELAKAFLDGQAGDAGKDESGRLQNLRFHLQPFCAIWTVEGVSADPRTPGIAGGINGKSYGVHGPEAAAARQSAVAAGAVTIAGGDGDSGPAATATSTTSRPAAATATAISNVFSGGDSILRHGLPGMHSADMKMH